MDLVVNGEPYEHSGDGSLRSLLEEVGAASGRVAVMVDGEVIRAERRESVVLKDGSRVEILTFAAGG